MPSKNKHSKTASRLSKADRSASPQTPALTSSSSSKLQVKEQQDYALLLEEASSGFPFLIGTSAFVGHLVDVVIEKEHTRRGLIWLSESAMVASSLSPGCVVSVSLAASAMRSSKSFPLSSISGKCDGQFDAKSMDERTNGVGNYFALARVLPSRKVFKDEVRLSSDLSYTMGCPALGSVVFVYPIRKLTSMGLEDGTKESHNLNFDDVSFHKCNDLHLELVSFTDGVNGTNNMTATSKLSAESTCDQSENGIVSSPRTPPGQPVLSSTSTSQIASTRCEKSILTSSSAHLDFFDIKEVLKDESTQHLLRVGAASQLHSRILICGNLVAISMLGYHFNFRVISANKLPVSTGHQLMKEVSYFSYSPTTKSVDSVKDAFLIHCKTNVHLHPPMNSTTENPNKGGLPFLQVESEHLKDEQGRDTPKLGGLDKEYAVLKDLIASSMKNNLSSLGIRTTKGVLLHGPPGTGKTSLALLCALDAGANLFSVNGPEIIRQYYGESEQEMHKVFDSASQAAPSVVFIDELDAIAPSRKNGGEELSQRMVATLLNLMDGMSKTDGILVIAATNRPDSIEPALRRPGRFDREIEIGVPSPQQRLDILHSLLGKVDHSLSDMQIQHLAMVTHGFVGADLAALVNEAALVCLRHYDKLLKSGSLWHPKRSYIGNGVCSDSLVVGCNGLSEGGGGSETSNVLDLPVSLEILPYSCVSSTVTGIADNFEEATSRKEAISVVEDCMPKVAFEDFDKARMKVRPSAMREVMLEVPKVNWEEVGGQTEVKNQLMEAVEWPQRHQDAFKRIGIRPPTGVLMFGPPGCSKTLMARAVASEAGLNFLAVKGPELFSKWVGESEKAVRSLFAKARANAPSVIFFDEIDGLAVTRGKESDGVSVSDRVMSQLLVELDGLHQRVDVTVIAATNRPEKIDPALLRPGRFDRLLYVGPPNETDREEIFRIHLRKIPCSSEVNIKELAHHTDGYTGADISLICREAAIAAIEENISASKVTMEHLKSAIRQVQPTDIQPYEELSAKFQRLVHTSHGENSMGYQNCPNGSNGDPTWTPIRSIMQFFHRLLPSGAKSASNG